MYEQNIIQHAKNNFHALSSILSKNYLAISLW